MEAGKKAQPGFRDFEMFAENFNDGLVRTAFVRRFPHPDFVARFPHFYDFYFLGFGMDLHGNFLHGGILLGKRGAVKNQRASK